MIAASLYRNPRLLVLVVGTIVVAGLSSYQVLPRMEDPVLTRRVALINTVLPGADAQRVEALVTGPLEQRLRDSTIKTLQSVSRAGISTIVVELRDQVVDVDPVWSRIRDQLSDAVPDLPDEAFSPDLRTLELKAYAAIIALQWKRGGTPNFAILQRLAAELQSAVGSLAGTEAVDLFGNPGEEVVVAVDPAVLATMGLSCAQVSHQIRESNTQQSAGLLRGPRTQLLLDVDEEIDSWQRLGQTPIQYGRRGRMVSLSEIASISQGIVEPPTRLAYIDSLPSVVLGAFVRDDDRLDHWAQRLAAALTDYESRLPPGIEVDVIFAQNDYVQARLQRLLWNLLLGTVAVVVVIFLLMGWRSTLVVGTALPLSALIVLSGLRLLGIPIHQMSVTGLIIALGLLIDNAIVIVDEVRARIWSGCGPVEAIGDGIRHLGMPLFGSTLTTTLAFTPIALLPGHPGEFVRPIAISVILAINGSFLLAMTVVPALTAILQPVTIDRRTCWRYGFSNSLLRRWYERSLDFVFRVPWLGVLLGTALPVWGFWCASTLPVQFFPPSERDQLQLEVELAADASIDETVAHVRSIQAAVMAGEEVSRVHWFLGQSAPTFYYNVVPRRVNTPFYGQAIVQLKQGVNVGEAARRLQTDLGSRFGKSRLVVRQLEQGPPFDAPLEIRLFGPDLAVLTRLGSELRLLLSETPAVISTRADLEETVPKLALHFDEPAARMAGLSHHEIARQLYTTLEGTTSGTLREATEEIPIRVRLANHERGSLNAVAAVVLQSPFAQQMGAEEGPPLAALARWDLDADTGSILHVDRQRVNEVKAYLTAGTLPAEVVAEFEQRLADSDFQLPEGYSMVYGGEEAKRNEAVGNLLADIAVLVALMIGALVVTFGSFRIAAMIAAVGGLSIGLGVGAQWFFGYPFGFMAIVGTMGLVGVALNDAIVVMAGIRDQPEAHRGEPRAVREVVVHCTRHVVATSLTTIAGFTPLVLGGGQFWPPLAIAIAGGVGGATVLALYFVPALYLIVQGRGGLIVQGRGGLIVQGRGGLIVQGRGGTQAHQEFTS